MVEAFREFARKSPVGNYRPPEAFRKAFAEGILPNETNSGIAGNIETEYDRERNFVRKMPFANANVLQSRARKKGELVHEPIRKTTVSDSGAS